VRSFNETKNSLGDCLHAELFGCKAVSLLVEEEDLTSLVDDDRPELLRVKQTQQKLSCLLV